ncbi:hypothetical protein CRENBAI_010706 [Crenichthys baileyi]|uniref:Uncharacterized protein n=1 Tax=Crenichthys baileyi TaxID=28760 RepID=A0AAV9RMF1_9TELE
MPSCLNYALSLRHIMSVFLLLIAFFSVGYSSESYDEMEYGSTYRKRMSAWVDYIEFIPKSSSKVTILWSRDAPEASEDSRWKMVHYYFFIYNMTQRDSGQYLWRNGDRTSLSTMTVEVIAKTQSLNLQSGQKLSITSDLQPNSCNIYFMPEDGRETEIVRRGQLLQDLDQSDCIGFKLIKPCGVLNTAVKKSCSGQFVVRDHNDDQALVVSVKVESSDINPKYILPVVGAFVCMLLSCCIKTCFFGKSSRKKDQPELEDADGEPAAYEEYEHEPVALRPSQPSGPTEMLYPLQPSNARTGPLIHNPPERLPPSYSKEWRTSHTNVPPPTEQLDTPTVPLSSHQDQDRFELKGIDTNNLLSSDSPHSDVYTSDKLNFL